MVNFDLSRILIDVRNSCDIMYLEFFKILGLRREKLWPYEGSNLQAFNGVVNFPYGYIKLMVILGEGRDIRTVYIKFIGIPYRSAYNCILGRSFITMMDVVASLIHLKFKYHNIHDELEMICADLFGAQIINKALQRDQKRKDKEKVMEISVASLTKQLKEMAIKPPKRKDQNS